MPLPHAVIRPANHVQRSCRFASPPYRKRTAARRTAAPDSQTRARAAAHGQSVIRLALVALLTLPGAFGQPALAQYRPAAPGLPGVPAGSVGTSVPSLSALSNPAGANSAGAGATASAGGPPATAWGLAENFTAPAVAPPGPTSGSVQYAAPPRRRGAHPAVVRIVAPGRGSISYGSGSLVAVNERHGLVITNWHVINEATGQITVEFPDGFESPATVQKVDRDWDLAALAIWRPEVAPIPLARAAPRQGELLTIAGYGSGRYRAASGVCTQYVAPGLQFPYEMVELAAAARQGDSGGPILNSRGELAGVLFGEGQGRTAGSYCGRVQWFLDSVVRDRRGGADPQWAQVSRSPALSNGAAATAANSPPNFHSPPALSAPISHNPQIAAQEPIRGETLHAASSDSSHTWRNAGNLSAPRGVNAALSSADSPAERPVEVASSSKRGVQSASTNAAGSTTKENASGVSPDKNPLSPAVDPLDERWRQVKAFFGVVATVGVLLLIVRSLGK